MAGAVVTLALLVLRPVDADAAQLTVSWTDNSGGVAATRLERRLATSSTFVRVADVPPRQMSYVDGGLESGVRYCYRAFAHHDGDVSPYSEEACGTASGDLSVTVSVSGSGSGTVNSTGGGISCGGTCSAPVTGGSVTLRATAARGSTFAGWSGGCAGTGDCVVAGNSPVAVTATFLVAPSGRCSLPAGEVGVSYRATCTVAGGASPYTCKLVGGSLPSGVTLDAACGLSGTPTAAGSSTFTARIVDRAGAAIDVPGTLTIQPRLAVTTTSVPSAEWGESYAATLSAAGANRPFQWALVDGELPEGLALDRTTGTIRGTPRTMGVATIIVRVTDTKGARADRSLKIVVNHGSMTAHCAASGEVGASYQGCVVRGGLVPYSCVLTSGQLPSGVTLGSDCTVRGAPAEAGEASFQLTVSDASGARVPVATTVDVVPAIEVTTSALPAGTVGRPFSATLTATGGVSGRRWVLISGELPDGLALDARTGEVTGTPTAATGTGGVPVLVRVIDAVGGISERTVTVTVTP
jgi:hypothetical protein